MDRLPKGMRARTTQTGRSFDVRFEILTQVLDGSPIRAPFNHRQPSCGGISGDFCPAYLDETPPQNCIHCFYLGSSRNTPSATDSTSSTVNR